MPADLEDRGKALEEQFFQRQDAELIEKLRARREGAARRAALASASGLQSEDALDALEAADISAETVAALAIVPLVAVGWADGRIDPKERDAILKAAAASGLGDGEPAHALLESWLNERPGPELLDAWRDYARDLPRAVRASLHGELLGRAREVAEAAGGFLGLGNKVSAEEERVLTELEAALDGDA